MRKKETSSADLSKKNQIFDRQNYQGKKFDIYRHLLGGEIREGSHKNPKNQKTKREVLGHYDKKTFCEFNRPTAVHL